MAETTSLHLRLPKKLYKRLQQQARRNNVSLNTEIVNQLEGYEAATVERTIEMVRPLLEETNAQLAQVKDEIVHALIRAMLITKAGRVPAGAYSPDEKVIRAISNLLLSKPSESTE